MASIFKTGPKAAMAKQVRTVTLFYDQSGIMDRRERDRGGEVNQLEHETFVTRAPSEVPAIARKRHSGFNNGNAVGPIGMPDWRGPDTMQATFNKKDLVRTAPTASRWVDARRRR